MINYCCNGQLLIFLVTDNSPTKHVSAGISSCGSVDNSHSNIIFIKRFDVQFNSLVEDTNTSVYLTLENNEIKTGCPLTLFEQKTHSHCSLKSMHTRLSLPNLIELKAKQFLSLISIMQYSLTLPHYLSSSI